MVLNRKPHSSSSQPHAPRPHYKSHHKPRDLPSEVITNPSRPQWLQCSPRQIDLVFFDLETTGGNPRNSSIIEIGAIKYQNGIEVGRFETLINPKRYIPHIVRKITGIHDEAVKAAPAIEEVFDALSAFIGNSVIVAHGAQGDVAYLVHHMRELKNKDFPNFYFCTHLLVSDLLPNLSSKKLGAIAEHFKVPLLNAHSAIADAEMTASVFWKLLEICEKHSLSTCDDLLKTQGDVETIRKLGPGINPSIVNNVPTTPGILYLLNSHHEISYLTASANIKRSLQQLTEIGLDREINRIIVDAAGFKFERTTNLLDALIREKRELKRVSLPIDPRKSQRRSENFLQILIPSDMLNYARAYPEKVPFLIPKHSEVNYDTLHDEDYALEERKNNNLYVNLDERENGAGDMQAGSDDEAVPIQSTKKFLRSLRADKFRIVRSQNQQDHPHIRIGHLKEGIGYFFGPFANPKKALAEVEEVLKIIPFEYPSHSMQDRFTHLRTLIALLSGNIEQEITGLQNNAKTIFIFNNFTKWLKGQSLLKETKRLAAIISPEHLNLSPRSGLCIISNNDFKEFEISIVVKGKVCRKLRLQFEQGERLKSSRYFTRLFENYRDEIYSPLSPIVFTDDMCSDIELFAYWLQNKKGEGEWIDFFELAGLYNTAIL